MNRKKVVVVLVVSSILVSVIGYFVFVRQSAQQEDQSQNKTEKTSEQKPETPENKDTDPEPTQPKEPNYDIDSPSSLTVLVNKNRPLPADYVPADLITPNVTLRLGSGAEQMQFRATAEESLIQMFNAALGDGVTLVFGSGYRSYNLQKQFYDSYVARDGQAAADRYSARPGTSEHQTGLSFDATSPSQTCHLEVCFEKTAQGEWLAANAHTFGFHLRYRDGRESITGYQYEPWHYRYLGTELSSELFDKNLTLEEYFNL